MLFNAFGTTVQCFATSDHKRGGYRQFHQVGVEAFGVDGAGIEVELILISARLFRMLGIDKAVRLEVNTLGDSEDRQRYRSTLVDYLNQYKGQLDEDSLRRLHSNPLRILDSKNPSLQPLIESAPRLLDVLGRASREHFREFTELLNACGVTYIVNHRLVRGLDYYSHIVFEWVTDQLGAQGTVCAGGRYDGLIEQLGGGRTPGVGWAMGVERLLTLIEVIQGVLAPTVPQAYLVLSGVCARTEGLQLAEYLRDRVDGLRLMADCSGGSLKSQFKRADKSGATHALVLGDREIEAGVITVKSLRDGGEQQTLDRDALCILLAK